MQRAIANAFILSKILLGCYSAVAQDVFRMLGTGAEAKVHAGAGQLHARGSAANYYNPANLILTKSLDPEFGFDLIRLDYQYAYPSLESVSVKRWIPLPFLGLSGRPSARWAYGVSLLPIPGDSGKTEVLGLPTRRITSDPERPTIVDATSGGDGFGFRASAGGAVRIIPGFTVGLSFLVEQQGSVTEASDTASGTELTRTETKTMTSGFLLGTRGTVLAGLIKTALSVEFPSNTTQTGESQVSFLTDVNGDPVSVDMSGKKKGPLRVGLGVGLRAGAWQPFVEYRRGEWAKLKEQQELSGDKFYDVDYLDTDTLIVGIDYGDKNVLTGAMGFYQSHLGEGIIAERAANGQELIGMEFQNIDAIPYTVVAGGYRFLHSQGHLQTGMAYLSGERDVSVNSRGYGSYQITIISLIAGGTYRF